MAGVDKPAILPLASWRATLIGNIPGKLLNYIVVAVIVSMLVLEPTERASSCVCVCVCVCVCLIGNLLFEEDRFGFFRNARDRCP
jgi:hypothetical protein